MANWFCSSVGWTAVTAWAASTAYSIGDIRRQLATPTVGNERVWRCTTAGTSGGSEPSWTLTQGSSTTDNTVVWTEITGSATYNTIAFSAPHARLQTAVKTGFAAVGDTIYVATDHAETQTTQMGITCVGTDASPNKIICINTSFSNPPVSGDIDTTPGASVTTTGNSQIDLSGSAYWYGITFNCGSGANSPWLSLNRNNGGRMMVYDKCTFNMGGTSGGHLANDVSGITEGANTILYNCNSSFASTSSNFIARGGRIRWNGGAHSGTVPNQWSGSTTSDGTNIFEFHGFDFSAGTWTSKYLVNMSNITEAGARYRFINCKVADSLTTFVTGTLANTTMETEIAVINTDDTTNEIQREEYYQWPGSLVSDSANYRTGGSNDGTNSKAWKVVTLSGANRNAPFLCPNIYQWNDTTGTKTITIYFATTTGGPLQDDDIGFELEYLGSSTSTMSTVYTTNSDRVTTGTDWTTDATSSWVGLSSPTQQYMSATVTVNAKGLLRVKPFVMKLSQTVWIDPLIVVT